MWKKEGYCKLAVRAGAQITCCALNFSRLTNKFICTFHNSVKSLCVYTKIIQGEYASKRWIRARKKNVRSWHETTCTPQNSLKTQARHAPYPEANDSALATARYCGFCGSEFCTGAAASPVPAGRGFKVKSTPRAAFSSTVRCRSTRLSSTALSPPYEVT
jgi:hypothetical protein